MKPWVLISGVKGAGTSALVQRVAQGLAVAGVPVGGFVQEAVHAHGERVGYRLRRLDTDATFPLARRDERPSDDDGEARACSFVFDPTAFATARRWLADAPPDVGLLVIDEVSKLEVSGRGHHDAVVAALESGRPTLLAVRADQLFLATERFGLDEPLAALEVGPAVDLDAFVATLAAILRRRGP